MPDDLKPAECFHPGEYIMDELKARGWTENGFAKRLGMTWYEVANIVVLHAPIDAAIAEKIGAAFGTGPEIWMNLQEAYDKWRAYNNADA